MTGTATVQQQKPQKAAPEDLQKIVAGWRAIVGQTTGLFKQSCSVQSPSITEKQEIPSFMWNSRIFWG